MLFTSMWFTATLQGVSAIIQYSIAVSQVQKKVLHTMGGISYNRHSGTVFKEWNSLYIWNMNRNLTETFLYKRLNNGVIKNWLTSKNSGCRTRSTNQIDVRIPQIIRRSSEQVITYHGPTVWITTSEEVRGASLCILNNECKNCLIHLDS